MTVLLSYSSTLRLRCLKRELKSYLSKELSFTTLKPAVESAFSLL